MSSNLSSVFSYTTKNNFVMNFEVIQHEQTPKTPVINNVSDFIENNVEAIEAFRDYAIHRRDCIGLAANQCLINDSRFDVRVIAVKSIINHECTIAIDPKITRAYGVKRQKAEGCLTWGWNGQGHWVVIADRYNSVDVEFYTLDGKLHKETHKGYQAQVWQHEVNHINGIPEVVTNESFVLEEELDKYTQRNDICPCGSGLKYKKCCINNGK